MDALIETRELTKIYGDGDAVRALDGVDLLVGAGEMVAVMGPSGSGKSTLVALMVSILERRGYEVLVLDGDASNPEGLVRLMFGLGVDVGGKRLIKNFGGVDTVTCPVDDPSPLTRIDDARPVPDHRIDVS